MRRIRFVSFCVVALTVSSCKEKFDPPIISSDNSYLVVEGVLNAGSAPTTIHITRTFGLDQNSVVQGEIGATVTVEGKDNSIQPLTMGVLGQYSSPGLILQSNAEYRVRIQTNDGNIYVSGYVMPRQTPGIDSVGWRRSPEGVQLYVNTHDNSNSTRYYRWDYIETWQLRSYYFSGYIYQNAAVRQRVLPQEQVYDCWRSASSQSILLGSSARLSNDVINEAPLAFYANGDERMNVRYSLLVRQYAMDKPAFEFYELMKKNTESVGTIFDSQPSDIRGNIICETDPSKPVIGFITASTISEKRIFINSSELPGWNLPPYCPPMTVTPDSIVFYFQGGAYMPYSANFDNLGLRIISYNASFNTCVDCQTRGGSTIQPSFW